MPCQQVPEAGSGFHRASCRCRHPGRQSAAIAALHAALPIRPSGAGCKGAASGSLSRPTLDRLLKPIRVGMPSGLPGTLLKNPIPIRAGHWDISQPGVVEADTGGPSGQLTRRRLFRRIGYRPEHADEAARLQTGKTTPGGDAREELRGGYKHTDSIDRRRQAVIHQTQPNPDTQKIPPGLGSAEGFSTAGLRPTGWSASCQPPLPSWAG